MAKNFKATWKYKCYTVFTKKGEVYFQVEDVTKPITWAEYLCNGKLYHDTLRDCIGTRYSQTPVMYRGENINVWQPDIFIRVDGCGRYYREYHFDDTKLRKYEKEKIA